MKTSVSLVLQVTASCHTCGCEAETLRQEGDFMLLERLIKNTADSKENHSFLEPIDIEPVSIKTIHQLYIALPSGTHLAVQILMRFPQMIIGIVARPKAPISIPKMPNGSAGPAFFTQSLTKNVHAKDTIDRTNVTATKQSPATELYDSIR